MVNTGIMDDKEFEDLIGSKKVSVVDFSATWCGPCRMFHPVLEHVADKHKGEYNFYQIDIDSAENIAVRQGITAVPTVVIYKEGKELGRTSGYQEFDEFEEFLLNSVKN